mmetsp:Transcript_42889/g.99658  ORF Transcript_42889/g.99658 Transcript_42889/m.99658 type:complete len:123 (-) Transcript_42889:12-380(-)
MRIYGALAALLLLLQPIQGASLSKIVGFAHMPLSGVMGRGQACKPPPLAVGGRAMTQVLGGSTHRGLSMARKPGLHVLHMNMKPDGKVKGAAPYLHEVPPGTEEAEKLHEVGMKELGEETYA